MRADGCNIDDNDDNEAKSREASSDFRRLSSLDRAGRLMDGRVKLSESKYSCLTLASPLAAKRTKIWLFIREDAMRVAGAKLKWQSLRFHHSS